MNEHEAFIPNYKRLTEVSAGAVEGYIQSTLGVEIPLISFC